MSEAVGVLSYRVEDGVAVLTIDSPPVNALSHAVRVALCEGTSKALADEAVQALVLICAGRTFFAGADVTEIGKPILPPLLADVMAQFEASMKPIVAAMHGTALGGGLELALAGHYRVAVPSAVVGLPEVKLGLLPGAGGTQRLPRLIGVADAIEMIGLGRHVTAPEALKLGLIDSILSEGQLEAQAIEFARKVVAEGAPLRRLRDVSPDLGVQQARVLFDQFRRAHPELFVGLKAAGGVLQAIEAAITLPFEEGLEREREISRALIAGPESAAQRHLFFAERAAAKLPGAEKEKVPVLEGVSVSGDWPDEAALRATGLGESPTVAICAEEGDRDAYRNAIARQPAPTLIATKHLDALDALGEGLSSDKTLVGLKTTRGVTEIVVGAHTSPAAALTAMAVARRLGRPAIYVTPSSDLVIERLLARLAATITQLREAGVPDGTIAATGRAFGYGADLLPEGKGEADPALEPRLIYPLLAEAQALIDDGTAMRASDVDFAAVRAKLWPVWRGGPAFMAQRIGNEAIAAQLALSEDLIAVG